MRLPLSYDNQTTTSPHTPLYVLLRWYWKSLSSHSVCDIRNLVRGQPEIFSIRCNSCWVVLCLDSPIFMLAIKTFRCYVIAQWQITAAESSWTLLTDWSQISAPFPSLIPRPLQIDLIAVEFPQLLDKIYRNGLGTRLPPSHLRSKVV